MVFNPDVNARHYKYPYKSIYHRLVTSAKKRNLELDITYKDFLEYTKEKECYYCGDYVEWVKHGKKASKYNLDRLYSDKGYTKENCVVCCQSCNFFKLNLNVNVFLLKIDRIHTRNLK